MSVDYEERLIQRAVDGELSDDQRRDLFAHCDRNSDSWKKLACAFLEDHLVGQAIGDRTLLLTVGERDIEPVRPAEQAALKWHQHPAVAVALTVSTAFVLGLIFPWDVGSRTTGPTIDALRATAGPGETLPLGSLPSAGIGERESVVVPVDEMDLLREYVQQMLLELERRPLPQSEFRPMFPILQQPQSGAERRE